MKTCPEHRHEHRQLPCPWPDCPNGESAADTFEVPRHTGAGAMTAEERGSEVEPPPRVFGRQQWVCDKCNASGWVWVEAGSEIRQDRCPHRRTATVRVRDRGIRR